MRDRLVRDIVVSVRGAGVVVRWTRGQRVSAATVDGRMVRLPRGLDSQSKIFLLLHLAGHCIQWATSSADRGVALISARNFDETDALAVARYELSSIEYGLGLLPRTLRARVRRFVIARSRRDVEGLLRAYGTSRRNGVWEYVRERRLRARASGDPHLRKWEGLAGARILKVGNAR